MNLPILPNLNHIGLTVHSIEETLNFYRQLTDVEIYEESTHIGGDGVGKIIAVDKPDYHSCMARIGNRNFELIEHHSSKGRHLYAHHNDVCGIHLAFMVSDIDEVFRRVKALGLEPTTAEPYTAHELGGYKAFFFRDLNGVQIEIGQIN
ncbi:VOC family protein [Acidovorax sp. SUPP3334]|uniref:VOC family protein n=1 Tax=Acidovorax sp. SUPP3334 TaxID=2920881 RepID=UPI0023DE1C11|nr:VOC family protein [Acidovorax sp. SUPP3334]GKT24596.1 VOC family protein [Acidovorax sp. SUPP3334]